MASLGSIGADEASGILAVQEGNIGAFIADCTVEEDNRNLAGSVQDSLSDVGVTGGDDVHDQQGGAASDSGLDLLQLLSLILTGILVVVCDTGSLQSLVQLGTDGAEVHVSLVVPENGNLSLCGLGATAGCQAQNHSQGQNNCDKLFHCFSSLIIKTDNLSAIVH